MDLKELLKVTISQNASDLHLTESSPPILRIDGKLIPMDLKVGDKVLYGKYSGTEVKIEDVEHLIMHQDDILGIIE